MLWVGITRYFVVPINSERGAHLLGPKNLTRLVVSQLLLTLNINFTHTVAVGLLQHVSNCFIYPQENVLEGHGNVLETRITLVVHGHQLIEIYSGLYVFTFLVEQDSVDHCALYLLLVEVGVAELVVIDPLLFIV